MRLFVALELPAAAREAFAAVGFEAARKLHGNVRPIAAASLHVTLAFLGELDEAEAAAAGSALVAEPIGELVPDEILWLPPRRPGVLAVGLGGPGAEPARALQASVAAALIALDLYSPENRPWLPHVTVARVRRGSRVRPVGLALPSVAFVPPAVTLFRSRPGSRYEALARVELD